MREFLLGGIGCLLAIASGATRAGALTIGSFAAGQQVTVAASPILCSRIRATPGLSGTELACAPPTSPLLVNGLPSQCVDGYRWWNVTQQSSGVSGWAAVGWWMIPRPAVGRTVSVANLCGQHLNVRDQASVTTGSIVTSLPEGSVVAVDGGPVLGAGPPEAPTIEWWHVISGSGSGWAAVGYWLEYPCDDGTVSSGEQCDDVSALGVSSNGASTSCCTATCQYRAAGQSCRSASGECDAAETCTGSSNACPADGKRPPGATCSSDGNPCTLDQCDGVNVTCQHPVGNAGIVCRSSGGECDVAESCTGSSTACPGDGKQSPGVGCTSDGNPCTLDQCDGVNVGCQHPAGNAGTVCRSSSGECDVAEACTGSSPTCPGDDKQPPGTTCSSDGNPCTADQCDGASVVCQHPAGNAGLVCRPSVMGCDPAESCTGASPSCPADVNNCTPSCGNGTVDAGEQCDGTNLGGQTCTSLGFSCGGVLSCSGCSLDLGGCLTSCDCGNNVVDPGEQCDGSDLDGLTCQTEGFAEGVLTCRSDCSLDVTGCGGTTTCDTTPLVGCRKPVVGHVASVQINRNIDPAKDKVTWKWLKGQATTKADFGDPSTSAAYAFCLYDQGGLRLAATIPPGGTCSGIPCWRASVSGYSYKNKARTPDGIFTLRLTQGLNGRSSIKLKGSGIDLQAPALPLAPTVTAQLKGNGTCWDVAFSSPTVTTVAKFKAKGDDAVASTSTSTNPSSTSSTSSTSTSTSTTTSSTLWAIKAAMPQATDVQASTVAGDGALYAIGIGGTRRVVRYDPSTDSWSNCHDQPFVSNTTLGVVAGGATAIGNRIYGIGETFFSVNPILIYDTGQDAWTVGPSDPNPDGGQGPSLAALGGNVYVIGGYGPGDLGTAVRVDVFVPSGPSGTWDTPIAPLNAGRGFAATAVVGTTVYAIGGIGGGGTRLTSVEAFDTANPSVGWVLRRPMPSQRGGAIAGVVNDRIYVAGGGNGAGANLRTVDRYDPASDSWTTIDPMNVGHAFGAGGAANGLLFVAGGYTDGGAASNVTEQGTLP